MVNTKIKKFKPYHIIRLEKGEEIISALSKFTKKYKIRGAFFFGLGVGKNLTLGYFDGHRKSYIKRRFKSEYEFTSLVGNISYFKNQIVVHAHATITDRKFNAFGGHVFEAFIPATCEIIILSVTKKIKRKKDKTTGLNLLYL